MVTFNAMYIYSLKSQAYSFKSLVSYKRERHICIQTAHTAFIATSPNNHEQWTDMNVSRHKLICLSVYENIPTDRQLLCRKPVNGDVRHKLPEQK